MSPRLICLLGVIAFIFAAWSISTDRRRFPWRVVIGGLLLQFSLAVLILKTTSGQWVMATLGAMFVATLSCVQAGSGFIFGGPPDQADFNTSLLNIFAFNVLPTIVFFSSLMSILYYFGVMQLLVKALAFVMRYSLGTSGTETLAAAANVFVGQTEAPLVIRPYLAKMTRSELMAMMTGGFSTVAGGVMAIYVSMGIDVQHLMTASLISAPAALLIAKVMVPESEDAVESDELPVEIPAAQSNAIGAAVEGASEGMKLAINVAAMLIAFFALIALVDLILGTLCGYVGWVDDNTGAPELTLTIILSYLFWPLAWLLSIPVDECFEAAALIGVKTVASEFIAYQQLGVSTTLSPRSVTVLTYALCGFSNLASIGIMVGGVGALEPSKRDVLAKYAFRAMLGGTLACCMTGAIVGILL